MEFLWSIFTAYTHTKIILHYFSVPKIVKLTYHKIEIQQKSLYVNNLSRLSSTLQQKSRDKNFEKVVKKKGLLV